MREFYKASVVLSSELNDGLRIAQPERARAIINEMSEEQIQVHVVAAAQAGQLELLELLVERQPAILNNRHTRQDEGGFSTGTVALEAASEANHPEVLKWLLNRVQPQYSTTKNRKSPPDPGAWFGSIIGRCPSILEVLSEVQAQHPGLVNQNTFLLAVLPEVVKSGNLEATRYFLRPEGDAKRQLTAADKGKLLAYAASNNHLPLVQCLSETYPELLQDKSQVEHALFFAAQSGHADVVRFFINPMPSLEWIRGLGKKETPLQIAARYGHMAVVRLLASKMSVNDINHTSSSDNKTALDMARQQGHRQVVEFLEAAVNPEKQVLLFAMAKNKRVGKESPVSILPDDLVGDVSNALYEQAHPELYVDRKDDRPKPHSPR